MNIAEAIAAAFAGQTSKSASLIGLYAVRIGRDKTALELRDALTGKRATVAQAPEKDILTATAAALEAMKGEREKLYVKSKAQRIEKRIARMGAKNTQRRTTGHPGKHQTASRKSGSHR